MKLAYFHCFAGISGNMALGALIDAGLSLKTLKTLVTSLPITGYEILAKKVTKNAISGTYVDIQVESENQPHRYLPDIADIIKSSDLSSKVKTKAIKIFSKLAQVEAKIHHTTPEKIHFHEVGGVDSIIDITGFIAAIDYLGIERCFSSPIHLGTGFIKCRHGMLPLPSPATTALLTGVPVYSKGIEAELTTPTGAALMSGLCHAFGPLPSMTISAGGYGAGQRDLPIPNLLRVIIGESEPADQNDEVIVVQANIDDMNPELFSHVFDKLFESGALDVFLVPIQMKQGRPGSILNVICSPQKQFQCTDIILRETTSLGVRYQSVQRRVLDRKSIQVSTSFGTIDIKIGLIGDEIVNIAPEYASCRQAALQSKAPLKVVYTEAQTVARAFLNKNTPA